MEDRITLRRFVESDLPDYWSIAFGPKADLRWMDFNGPYFEDPVLTWEEFSAKSGKILTDNPRYNVIIYNHRIIGVASAAWQDGVLKKWLDFGIAIYDSNLWGKGIGRRVVPQWIDQLFESFPEIQHLGCTTWSGNIGMMKLAVKCGLALEGRIRKVRFWQGEFYDSVKYGVLRKEWEAKTVKV
ncbi:MAG: GNAT family N-acetyltransferase [Streptococcaceae bacterium]|nr:GNAT family N-acetyltransferase [Streptococcaceae bacterium]